MGRANLFNRNANRRAREELEAAPGYTSSGEGQWSRHASAGGKVETPDLADIASMTRLEQLVYKNVRQLVRLEERISTSADPDEVARCIVNSRKKKSFIDRLRAEQRAEDT